MWKLSHREINQLSQSHPVHERQKINWTVILSPEAILLAICAAVPRTGLQGKEKKDKVLGIYICSLEMQWGGVKQFEWKKKSSINLKMSNVYFTACESVYT